MVAAGARCISASELVGGVALVIDAKFPLEAVTALRNAKKPVDVIRL